jgi:hypothetical protein
MSAAAGKTSQLLTFPLSTEATSLLREDHKFVQGLFQAYPKIPSTNEKRELVTIICQELAIQAQLKMEVFYPAINASLNDQNLLNEAAVKQDTLNYLMAQVEGKNSDDEVCDAKIKNLADYLALVIKHEQNEIFPRVRQAKIDMISLGEEIAQRRKQLMDQLYD